MAKAQDVAAIPKIAEMAAAVERNHRGHAPVGSLSSFRTPKAVGFLNPLIISGTEQVRFNAMESLHAIADKSSIPYLMQALDKDDSQHMISYWAYSTLHRLSETLAPAQTMGYFDKHRESEVALLKQWWEWEQVKAAKAATRAAPATTLAK
jgi:HEAT repeat protein